MVRETQAQYLTEQTPMAEATRRAVQVQVDHLEMRLARERAQAYAAGYVLSAGTQDIDPVDTFGDGDMDQAVYRLGGRLLADAYSRLPVGPHLMTTPLQPGRDAPLLFDGAMLAQPSDEAVAAPDAFAPGLGLSTPDAPRSLDVGVCPAFRLIEAELEQGGGEIDGRTLGWRLAHHHGLTYPLAALFTMPFLWHAQPVPQVRLGLPSNR